MPEASVSPVAGWFTTEGEAALIGTRCARCGTYAFPPESFFCRNPSCSSSELEEVRLSRTGTIWSYTINHYAPPPPALSPDPFVPYAVAAVELATEQMVILGQVSGDADLGALRVGAAVELVVEPIVAGADEHTWKWRPLP